MEFVSDINLAAKHELVSFDVVSLFTKIPVDLAIKVAKKRLREDVSLNKRTTLPVEFLIDLLSFCHNKTYFLLIMGQWTQVENSNEVFLFIIQAIHDYGLVQTGH